MTHTNDASIELLIKRYQQKIFALVVYLIGGNKDKSYEITASCFAEVIQTTSLLKADDVFVVNLAAAAVKNCRDIQTIPSFDETDFLELPQVKRKTLQIANEALQALPFDIKALLLLRDQLHLSYKQIAAVFRIPEKDAKVQTTQAKIQLRTKMEEVLRHGQ